MYWEKKICIRLTTRRIMGVVLMASAVVNIVIVGAVFEAAASTSPLTLTPLIVTTTQLNTVPATTAVFVATETATSAAISTSTSTVRLTATDIATDLPTLTMCIVQSSWPSYYVQQGDTLLTLARLTGSSMDELMLANCLPDQNIRPGQLLYVLRLPFKPFTFTPSAAPTDTPTATPTNTSSVTPTPTPSATQTDTPTATLTNTPNTPTVFQDPYGELSLCSIYPSEIFFHVTPSDSQGVRSVSVSYQIDDGPWIDLPMGPDGDTYYGGQSLNGDYSAAKKVTYFFSAFDNSEDQTNTIVYDASITYCPYQGG